ncbi:MAG: PKD domain-containing protein [Deltaproteobacteria bacterium]|jgi:PKD repeat protein
MRRAAAFALLAFVACSGRETIVNQPPVAIAPADVVTRPGVSVTLDGGASKDADGEIVEYRWDFGDGDTGEGRVVEHVWQTAGVFAVTLTVVDDLGGEDVDALKVTTSTGTNTNQMPSAVIMGPARGLPGETLAFDGTSSSDADGSIVAYRWTFGDGGTADAASTSYVYTAEGSFTVTLEVEDDEGALGRASRSVVIGQNMNNRAPLAEAGPDLMAALGEEVRFNGTASTDPDGDPIVSYAWDFGDGATGSTPESAHVYTAPGTYTATLVVTDDGGLTGQDTTTVTIAPPASYDGRWLLNPSMGAQNCPRTQIVFPTAQLDLTGTTTMMASADVVGASRTMTGSVDRGESPPRVMLSWMGSESHASCGTATVRHSLSGTFTSETTLAGTVTVLYMWTDAFCNCSRAFDFTGAKQ